MNASTIANLLLITVLFGAIALGIGIIAGGWIMANRRPKLKPHSKSVATGDAENKLGLERALLASGRLRDLATSMATDVGEHNSHVEQIASEIRAIQPNDLPAAEAGLLRALSRIVAANEHLKDRLESAEKQIQSQAYEIRTHASDARTDPLTQLANRRAFDAELRRLFAEWQCNRTHFSLILLDIDQFKDLNDAHGHQSGDAVLKQVAITLNEVVRDMDVPCRYGGEEFAVILPNTPAADAAMLCEAIRLAIEEQNAEFDGNSFRISISGGVAAVTAAPDLTLLLKRADEALYESKQAGRNCTHIFDGTHCVLASPVKAISLAPAANAI